MGWDKKIVILNHASFVSLRVMEGLSYMRADLNGRLFTLIELANGCIWVEFRASWLKGLGQRIPLRIPLKPHTWLTDHSMIWAAQYRPFEGLPWSSWVKDSNIGLCVSKSWWRHTTRYVECWSVTQVLCIIFLYDQRNSGFHAHKISIIFNKNLCFLHA
jgi:hypothetical protein